MPKPLDLPADVRREDGRWFRTCPKCSKAVSHLRRNYCVYASNIQQPCIQCNNISNNPAGMHGAIRVSWYNSFQKSALSRGYCWEIDLDFLNALYELQGGRCALSDLPIEWSSYKQGHTASIDRIDNDRGYTEDNVQLVHKEVNMLRGSLPVDRLIELCTLIAERNR